MMCLYYSSHEEFQAFHWHQAIAAVQFTKHSALNFIQQDATQHKKNMLINREGEKGERAIIWIGQLNALKNE